MRREAGPAGIGAGAALQGQRFLHHGLRKGKWEFECSGEKFREQGEFRGFEYFGGSVEVGRFEIRQFEIRFRVFFEFDFRLIFQARASDYERFEERFQIVI